MSILSRLFGRGGADAPQSAEHAEEYQGFRIVPAPRKEGGVWRIAARIERDRGSETKVHELVRADTLPDEEAARAASLAKARQVIDEQGDGLFDQR